MTYPPGNRVIDRPGYPYGTRPLDNGATIRASVFNAASSVRVVLSGRWIPDDEDRTVPFSHPIVPTTNRAASTLDVRLGKGCLISAQLAIAGGAPAVGQCFGIISVGQGEGASYTDLETLVAGDVTAANRLAWPGSPVVSTLAGAGAVRTITGANPGAGAEIAETVPTGARWELISFNAQFNASAAVASRIPSIVLDDGSNIFYRLGVAAAITASQVRQINWAQGMPTAGVDANNTVFVTIPIRIVLGSAYRIRTITTGIDAGDTYTVIKYLVREWIEGA